MYDLLDVNNFNKSEEGLKMKDKNNNEGKILWDRFSDPEMISCTIGNVHPLPHQQPMSSGVVGSYLRASTGAGQKQ